MSKAEEGEQREKKKKNTNMHKSNYLSVFKRGCQWGKKKKSNYFNH